MSDDIQKIITPKFRVHYPNVFTPKAPGKGKEPIFGIMAIWTPSEFGPTDKKRWKALKDAMNAQMMGAFGKSMSQAPRTFKLGLRDGAEKIGDVDGCEEGTVFANITSKYQPGIVDLQGNEISLEEGNEALFHAGVIARATVNIYTFNNESKGIALGLQNLQLVKDDGTVWETGGRRNAAADFADDIEDADGDDGEEDTGFLD